MGVGEGSVEVKGGWRINTFFFFLTGSQAVLLPWSPVILKATGLSAQNVGIIMGVITLVGSLGIMVSLAAMRRTHSGAARRLSLLLLAALGSVFYITAVLLLPVTVGGNGCSISSNPSLALSNSSGILSPNFSDHSLQIKTTQSPLPIATSGKETATTTVVENVEPKSSVESTAVKSSTLSTALPVTTEKNTHTSYLNVISDQPKQNITGQDTTAKNALNTSSSIRLSTVNNGETTFKQTTSNGNTGNSTPNIVNTTELSQSKPKTTNQIPTTNIKPESKVSQTSFQSSIPYSGTKSIQVPSTTKSKDDEESISESKSARKTLVSSDDYSYYYDDDDYSEDESSDSKLRQSFSPYKTPYRFEVDGDQERNPVIPNFKNYDQPKGYFNDYINKYSPKQFRIPDKWHKALRKPSANHRTEVNKSPYHSDMTRLQSDQYKHYDQGRYDSPRKRLPSQYRPLLKHHERSSQIHNEHERRHKRTINLKHINSDSLAIKKVKRETAQPENHRSFDTSAKFPKFSRNSVDIRSLSLDIKSPVGIQVGVAILLILGSLVTTGIEAGVAKLWHCYTHGYDEGGVSQDILEKTITHTFQLSIYASHKAWSGLTSATWVIGGGVIAGTICLMGVEANIYSMLGGVHLALGICTVIMILVIPVPYGSVNPPKTRRPLSLYLDDEVLREGIRRLAFHIWVLVNGFVASLPITFGLWLILEMKGAQGYAIAGQTAAVSTILIFESLSFQIHKWLMTKIGLQGIMGAGGFALLFNLILMWVGKSVGVVVISFAGLGCCIAFLFVSVRHNALLLATVKDQEREAWASWWCWRIGLGVGSMIWGSCVSEKSPISELFKAASFIALSITFVVASVAAMTKRNGRTRRRVYHTLDLDMAGDEEEEEDDEEETNEDDWLVKRAKKEGIDL